jgi:hypothetical protein
VRKVRFELLTFCLQPLLFELMISVYSFQSGASATGDDRCTAVATITQEVKILFDKLHLRPPIDPEVLRLKVDLAATLAILRRGWLMEGNVISIRQCSEQL